MSRVVSLSLLLGATSVTVGCGNGSGTPNEPLGGSLMVSGDVYDFQTDQVLTATASVSTTALSPAPKITVDTAHFTIDGVPENSAFQILASAAPTHHATYSPAVEVLSSDVDGVKAYSVSEQYLGQLTSGFSVSPDPGHGILLLRMLDSAGTAKSGVTSSNIVLANATDASTPKFLDASLAPAPAATATSTSGWVVFFNVPVGTISLGTAANATQTLAMASSPIDASTVTIANVTVTDGAPPALPTNVSFSQQVFPIFSNRGCNGCHSGNGPGRDLGNLTLDGSANLVYKELTGTENPLRVQTAAPEKSLVLTMPSAETPSDGHPNVTFTGPQDPDYLKILVWIREGAKQN